MEMLLFLLFAALTLGSACVVVAHKNPVYATMSLVLTLFSLAMLFVMLGAPFVGVLQILIYTGAILVLFLFVIMLLNIQRQGGEDSQLSGQGLQFFGALIGALVFAVLAVLALWRSGRRPLQPIQADLVSLTAFSRELFSDYLLPFEIVGLLLLVAVIGATIAARRPPQADATEGHVQSGFEPRADPRRATPRPEDSAP